MDSQVTLVDPIAFHQSLAHTVLRFSVDNVHTTTIFVRGSSAPYYTVESSKHASSTKVTRVGSEPTVIGLIERSDVLPDKVTLTKASPVRVSTWLKSRRLSNLPATMEAKGRRYIWQLNIVGQLTLCAEEDMNTPLAWLDRSRTTEINGQTVTTPTVLALQEEADGFRDEVLVAALILEHRRRMSDKANEVTQGTHLAWQGSGGFVV